MINSKMIVYKITCESGRVYYGSTSNTLRKRCSKGWYKCSCKDFIIYKMEVLETLKTKEEMLERENYYIINFDSVNSNDAMYVRERQLERNRNNINKKESNIKYRKKVVDEERFKCDLCNICFQSKGKLKKHTDGFRHKLKNECFLKYGDCWKEHYLEDNKKRYNENRKIKRPIICDSKS